MVGFLTAAAVVTALPTPQQAPPAVRLRWPAELGAGLRHLAGEPALRRALLGYGLGSLVMGFSESLIFAYVDQGLNRDAAFVGVLVTVQGVGGLLGGLCSPALVRGLGEVGTLAAGVAFFSPAALALAYPDLRLGFAAVLLAGRLAAADDGGAAHADPAAYPAGAGRPGRRGHRRRWSAARRRSPSGRAPCWSGVLDYRLLFALVGVATWSPAATSGGAGT